MTDEQPAILDEGVLNDLRASVSDDHAFVADLVRTYLEDGAEQVRQIEEAAASGDPTGAVRPAHTLKSSSGTLGASRLAATARSLELAGRTASEAEIRSNLETLRDDWGATADALRRWLATEGDAR